MKKTEQLFESLMFRSRWLLAPFFFGLIIAIMAMLVKFGKQLFTLILALFGAGEHEDRPVWMGKVGFSDLKIKLMGAIVAISAVELLKAFINADQLTNTQLGWRAGIHLLFVVSGVLFAVTDRLTEGKDGGH